MFGIVGMLKCCGTHQFLVLICFIDLCFLSYDLGVRSRKMSAQTHHLLNQVEIAQRETEDLVEQNLDFFRKYVLKKHKEKTKLRALTEQLEGIEAILEEMRQSQKLNDVELVDVKQR